MYYDSKFENIIPRVDLDKLNSDVIEILISKSIIVEYTDELLNNRIFDNSEKFETELVFNSKHYEINEQVLSDFYEQMLLRIEFLTADLEFEKAAVIIEANGYMTVEKQIAFLESKHSEMYALANLEPQFLFFMKFKEFNGFATWEEFVMNHLRYHIDGLKKYLTTEADYPSIDDELLEQWLRYERIRQIATLCKEMVSSLTNSDQAELTETINKKSLDSAQKALLFDRLMRYENWEELSYAKKAFVLNKLTGSNIDNLRGYFSALDGQTKSPKSENDNKIIDGIMNELGN